MVERTKRALVDAFNRLIVSSEFDQITAQSIAEEADVSKATFYRYFKDKYDVMNYNYKLILDETLTAEGLANYRDLYRELYIAGIEKLRPIRKAFKSTGVNSLEHFVYTYSKEAVERITRLNRNDKGFTHAEEMQIDVFCYGISYMYRKWIFGEYTISPDEAADHLFSMMPESLRDYWFPQQSDSPTQRNAFVQNLLATEELT